jgi:hypothetical protein
VSRRALEKLVALAQGSGGVGDELDLNEDSAHSDASCLMQGLDASLDEAIRLLKGHGVDDLPPQVRQACSLLYAAQSVCDHLMDQFDIDDPDDEMSEYARMTGSYSVGSPLWVALASRGGDPQKPYGDVRYADPGYQSDNKKRYPLDTEARVRSAWTYINVASNAGKYSSDQLARVKAAIKAAGRKLGISYADDGGSDSKAA